MAWEIIISLIVAFVGGSILIAFCSAIWFRIRWATGWRPKILNEETVDVTSSECATVFMDWLAAEAERAGVQYSEEELRNRREVAKLQMRSVIERYIENFSKGV